MGTYPPLSRDLFIPALSLALLRMRARMSARVAARKCVGGDPTNALFILRICASIVGGAISFRDLLLSGFTSLCERLNESHAVFHRPVVCAMKTEL